MKTLADRLQYLLNHENITAYELSSKSGINEATISRLLNGKTQKPNIKNIEILAKYFKVSRKWILSGDDLNNDYRQENTNNTIDEPNINPNKYTEIMTPDRFDRLLSLMEDQQRAINQLIENQNVLAHKIPNHNNEHILGGASGQPA